MSFCPKCGAQCRDDQNFCEKCGGNLVSSSINVNPQVNSDSQSPLFQMEEKKSNVGKTVAILVLTIVAIILFTSVFMSISENSEASANAEAQAKLEATAKSFEDLVNQDDWATRFDVSNVKFVHENYSLYITGTIQNKTNRTFSYAQIEISLFNAAGDRVGSTMDNLNNFSSGSKWKFKAVVFEDDVKTCQIEKVTAY